MMVDAVREFVKKELPPGAHVTCAVSGGADSMALLCCMMTLEKEGLCTVSAAHFNHLLRGAESDGDEAFVRQFCEKHGVFCAVGRGDAAAFAKENRLTLEEAARSLRYEFLEAQEGFLATAHTADDNAETVLMNLLRGTGVRGLSGIPPVRGRIIRPMLGVTREELTACLREAGISWREDSTNQEDDCRRNRLRHRVLPLLRQENPALSKTLYRACVSLREDEAFLEQAAKEAEEQILRDGGLDCAALSGLAPAMQRRVLRRYGAEQGVRELESGHTEAMLALAKDSRAGAVPLPGDLEARICHGVLRVFPRTEQKTFAPKLLTGPGSVELPEAGLAISCALQEPPLDFLKNTDTFAVSYDMITMPILIRPRQEGDTLWGFGGHRSLKKRMIDQKIPAPLRGLIPVFLSDDRVIGVAGMGADQSVLPKAGQRAWVITVEKRSKGEKTNAK